jgi:hypothetical protein
MKRYFAFILMIVIGAIILEGCKGKKPEGKSGIVTFKLGSVRLQKPDSQPTEARIKDLVLPGDTIMTGEKSTVVVQFEENCVVKVEESSTLKVTSISDNNREIIVKQGNVLAKLIRTGNNNAAIITPTAIAAVRGTQFSVKYMDGKTLVAVTDGKVAVKAVHTDDAGKATAPEKEETLTEAGKTAEVAIQPKTRAGEEAPLVLKIRPITEPEKKELKKIESIPVIKEVNIQDPEQIESTIQEAIGKEKENEPEGKDKMKALLGKKSPSIAEIREVFSRIDEITLYNGKVIQGAIISRGEQYRVLTPEGTISIPESEIKGSRILK